MPAARKLRISGIQNFETLIFVILDLIFVILDPNYLILNTLAVTFLLQDQEAELSLPADPARVFHRPKKASFQMMFYNFSNILP